MAMLNMEPSQENSNNCVNFGRSSVYHVAEIPIKGVIALITRTTLICLGRQSFTVIDLWKCLLRKSVL